MLYETDLEKVGICNECLRCISEREGKMDENGMERKST